MSYISNTKCQIFYTIFGSIELFELISPVLKSVCECAQSLSHVRLFADPMAVAPQAPLSMGFSRQEHWSGPPFPSARDLLYPGIKPKSPVSSAVQADSLPSEPSGNI